ncbi:MAG: CRISPR-associated endonuclease Cas2 [Parcubacteria group bacterium]|nr:CRISPR-associated endonuclease Cas2 [Parcubacteria group bacterium]
MSDGVKRIDRLGPNQQKVLLLVAAGIGLSLAKSPKQYFRVIKETQREWQKVNERALTDAIRSLYQSKLIRERENPDGSLTMVLTEKGQHKIITFNIDNMEIKTPEVWDKKWRIVLFDIPEKKRAARDVLRENLKRIGFYEFQKSVFVHPYPCQNEVDYLIEYYNIRPHVRIVTATELDNEIHLRKIFSIR